MQEFREERHCCRPTGLQQRMNKENGKQVNRSREEAVEEGIPEDREGEDLKVLPMKPLINQFDWSVLPGR